MTEEATAEVVKSDALAPALAGLEPSSARAVREAFLPALLKVEEWETQAKMLVVTDETQTAKMAMSRVLRLDVKRARVGLEKNRKDLNAEALARTKAINHAAGLIEALMVPIEKHLLEQETFGERAAEARRSSLREAREQALRALGTDPSSFKDLGAMDEATWASTHRLAEHAYESQQEENRRREEVRVEAERLASERRERERQEAVQREAERVDRERVQAEENARLRAEAEAWEGRLRDERAEREAAQAAADRGAREAEELAAAEREKTRRAEAELAAAQAAEVERVRKAQEAEIARLEAEAREEARKAAAPDREKLRAFADALRALPMPEMATPAGNLAAEKLQSWLSRGTTWLVELAEKL